MEDDMKKVILLIAAGLVLSSASAFAGPCSKEIEMVTQFLRGGGSAVPSVGSAAPAVPSTDSLNTMAGSSAATGALGGKAPSASPEALSSLKQAQTADAAGDETSCMEYIGKAKQLLGLVQ
jgi:hypothetical protein